MNGIKLERVQCAKDVSVTIAASLKFSQQCKDAAGKANRMLSFINRNFFKNKDIIILPVEYAGQFWSLHLTKDMANLETLQLWATKIKYIFA